ncbi:MAG: protein-disulfide reductase DsbD family protein, partial [Caulobacteraceae bacterium]|nr:protein-disulfide reductase DsbD family protein [Caulobacteraceae bacterium]
MMLAAALAGLAVASASAVLAAPVNTGHLQAELVAQNTAIAPGAAIHVALRQKIEPGWHTYWRNPGDSGQATTLAWTLPAGWRAGELIWPTPQRMRTGPLMDYGYSGEVLLPVTLAAPASARPGQTVALKAHAEFLVCKDICVPADADLSLALPVAAKIGPADPAWGARIAGVLADAPRPGPLKAAMTLQGGVIKLSVTGAPATGPGRDQAYFFPYDSAAIDHAQPQPVERGRAGLTLTLTPGSAFKTGKPPASLTGVLSLGARAYEITARAGPQLVVAAGLGPPAAPQGPGERAGRLGVAMAFAFLGGLILNLM